MNALRKRIEALESSPAYLPPKGGSVFLIHWVARAGDEPEWAEWGGQRINREPNESPEDFNKRAASAFKPDKGVRLVFVHDGPPA